MIPFYIFVQICQNGVNYTAVRARKGEMVPDVATAIPDGRNRRKQAERTAIERLKSAEARSESTQQRLLTDN